MTTTALAGLVTRLAPAQAAQTQQRRYEQRGGARRRAPGAGARSLLTDTDRVLVTVLYQRQVCSQKTLAVIACFSSGLERELRTEDHAMTALHRGRYARHGLTGPGLPYTTLRDTAPGRRPGPGP